MSSTLISELSVQSSKGTCETMKKWDIDVRRKSATSPLLPSIRASFHHEHSVDLWKMESTSCPNSAGEANWQQKTVWSRNGNCNRKHGPRKVSKFDRIPVFQSSQHYLHQAKRQQCLRPLPECGWGSSPRQAKKSLPYKSHPISHQAAIFFLRQPRCQCWPGELAQQSSCSFGNSLRLWHMAAMGLVQPDQHFSSQAAGLPGVTRPPKTQTQRVGAAMRQMRHFWKFRAIFLFFSQPDPL